MYIRAISVLILGPADADAVEVSGLARLVFHHQAWAERPPAIGLALVLVIVDGSTVRPLAQPDRQGTATADVAAPLVGDFVLPFEVVSVLLLAAVIGGVFLAERDDARRRSHSDL